MFMLHFCYLWLRISLSELRMSFCLSNRVNLFCCFKMIVPNARCKLIFYMWLTITMKRPDSFSCILAFCNSIYISLWWWNSRWWEFLGNLKYFLSIKLHKAQKHRITCVYYIFQSVCLLMINFFADEYSSFQSKKKLPHVISLSPTNGRFTK